MLSNKNVHIKFYRLLVIKIVIVYINYFMIQNHRYIIKLRFISRFYRKVVCSGRLLKSVVWLLLRRGLKVNRSNCLKKLSSKLQNK